MAIEEPSMGGTRLNKFLSEVGVLLTTEGDRLIASQRVTIGVVPELGTKVLPGDVVCVDSQPIQERSPKSTSILPTMETAGHHQHHRYKGKGQHH